MKLTGTESRVCAYIAPKFLEDREVAKIRHPRHDGWYWWRMSEDSDPRRYYLQFDGKQATPEGGGPTVPAHMLGGEWGLEATSPDENP